MFNHLIESSSHKEELARKGRFFLGTLAFYALLFAVGGVASIYAYDAHLENQSLEIVTLLPPVEAVAPAPEAQRNERPARQLNINELNVDHRRELILPTDRPIAPDAVSARGSDTPPVRVGVPVALDNRNSNAGTIVGPGSQNGTSDGGVHVANAAPHIVETEPPPAMKTPTPAPTPVPANYVKSIGVVTSKMLNKPMLNYPPLAKQAGIQGPVNVQVVIDETGKVISARAMTGNPLLQRAAEQAAYQARFSPTLLSNQPVKASGTITFNFILER